VKDDILPITFIVPLAATLGLIIGWSEGQRSMIKEGIEHGDIYFSVTTNGQVQYNWK